MTNKAFNLAQILVTLLFVFFDRSGINSSGGSIGKLAQILVLMQIRAFLSGLTQGLAQLAELATTTIIIIDKDDRGFFDLGIFLALKVFLYLFVAIVTISMTLLGYKSELTGYLSFDINDFFYELLPIIEILIFFIKMRLYQWPEIILEIKNKQFICRCGFGIIFF